MLIISEMGLIVLGYLLGSIPSSYLIGRVWGKSDLRQEGDGHISATAVYRYWGRIPFLIVIVSDVGKGVLAIVIAHLFVNSQIVLVLVAYATVIGHCWSLFIGFKGGLGGLILMAVAGTLAIKEVAIGIAVCLVVLIITRKSSWATYAIQITASAVLLLEKQSLVMIIFPLGLATLHFLKRLQTQRANPKSIYKHEFLDDLKRLKDNRKGNHSSS